MHPSLLPIRRQGVLGVVLFLLHSNLPLPVSVVAAAPLHTQRLWHRRGGILLFLLLLLKLLLLLLVSEGREMPSTGRSTSASYVAIGRSTEQVRGRHGGERPAGRACII